MYFGYNLKSFWCLVREQRPKVKTPAQVTLPRALRIPINGKDSRIILTCKARFEQFIPLDLFFSVCPGSALGNLGVNSGMAL